MSKQLTICTVSFESKEFITLNRDLINTLNPRVKQQWVIILNAKEKFSTKNRNTTYVNNYQKDAFKQGSYHHADGLNKSLPHIHTRFALFLDPDFFIIYPNWIETIIDYMCKKNIVVLGAPYHPSRFTKYRYFPSAVCMFIDTSKISREDLDFTPEILLTSGNDDTSEENLLTKMRRNIRQKKGIYSSLMSLINFYNFNFKRTQMIHSSKDTGYKIYQRLLSKKTVKHECFTSVYKKNKQVGDFLYRILGDNAPDRFSYIPVKKGYFQEEGFRENGLYDIDALGWEEYFFQEKPFGFHIKGVFQGEKDIQLGTLQKILSYFTKGVQHNV